MKRYLEKISSLLTKSVPEVYNDTYLQAEGLRIVRGKVQGEQRLIVDGARSFRYEGEEVGGRSGIRICPINQVNLNRLQLDFPQCQPLQEQK